MFEHSNSRMMLICRHSGATWLLALAIGMSGCTSSDTRRDSGASTPVSRLAGRYFGVAHSEGGDDANFLRLDGNGSGAIYDGLHWIKICRWNADSAGRVSFRSAPYFEMVYAFDGAGASDSVRGRLDLLERGTTSRWNKDISFHRLDSADKTPRLLGVPGGVYSDVTYVEEAGDLVGTEVFVGSVRDSLKFTVQWFEGSPGEIFIPSRMSVSGDTVRFRIGKPGADGTDGGYVFSQQSVETLPEAHKPGKAAEPVQKLPRTKSIAEFYKGETEGTCTQAVDSVEPSVKDTTRPNRRTMFHRPLPIR